MKKTYRVNYHRAAVRVEWRLARPFLLAECASRVT
jgi:hypothetical protein